MIEYTIVRDDYGHNYVIPAHKISEFILWIGSEGYELGIIPSWCDSVGGSVSLVKFQQYRIE